MKMKNRITLKELLTYYIPIGEDFMLMNEDEYDDYDSEKCEIGKFEVSKFLAVANDKFLNKKVKTIGHNMWNNTMEIWITDVE